MSSVWAEKALPVLASLAPRADDPDPAGREPPVGDRVISAGDRMRRFGQRAPWLLPLVVAAAVLLLSWPFQTTLPAGVDLSWKVGLQRAIQDGLRFGRDIVFTYGPLGFLGQPTPFLGATSALAFAAMVALNLVAALVIVDAARRLLPLAPAVLLALLAGRLLVYLHPFETLQWLAFALAVNLLQRDRVQRSGWVAVGAGVLAAVALLGKVDIGVFLVAGGAPAVLGISVRWRRDLAVYLGTLAVAVVGLWLLLGQQLADLPGYARGSYEIIAGFSSAMGVTHTSGRWLVAAFVLSAALIVALAFLGSRGWPWVRRAALGLVLAILLFALWKQGFVRDHFAATFTGLALAGLSLAPRRVLPPAPAVEPAPRVPLRPAPVLVLVMAVLVVAAGSIVVGPSSPATYLAARASVSRFAAQAAVVLRPWRWEASAAHARGRLVEQFALPSDVLALLAGRTVSIDPSAAAVAAADPDLIWEPVPVFQSYSAYTTYLDELNARRLAAPDRPQLILRQLVLYRRRPGLVARAIDGRNYWFESPAAVLERLCRYRQVVASGGWQVLADTGRACGTPAILGTVTAARGTPVAVPPAPSPNDIVIVRVRGLNDSVPGRLLEIAWKGPEWEVIVNGVAYRLVPGTVADGLVMSVPPAAQGSPPFAFGDPIRTIAIRERGRHGGGKLSYEFDAVPLPTS